MRNVSSIRTEKSIKEILQKGKICSISKKYEQDKETSNNDKQIGVCRIMIKIDNDLVFGFEQAIIGMRNPKNSLDKSDS